MYRRLLRGGTAFLAIAFLARLPPQTTAAEPDRFNIISIVTDDQGRWAVGAYGNKECRTPHMDRLAREGAPLPQMRLCRRPSAHRAGPAS